MRQEKHAVASSPYRRNRVEMHAAGPVVGATGAYGTRFALDRHPQPGVSHRPVRIVVHADPHRKDGLGCDAEPRQDLL